MWPNRQFTADLVTFTEEIFNRKLHFFQMLFSKLSPGEYIADVSTLWKVSMQIESCVSIIQDDRFQKTCGVEHH